MSQFMRGSAPGFTSIAETVEWAGYMSEPGRQRSSLYATGIIDSTAVDSGNTPTTTLRGGLVVAKKDSDGNLYAYDADASDGTQIAVGVLDSAWSVLDAYGVAEDKNVHFLRAANIVASTLTGIDHQARAQLWRQGFRFDHSNPDGAAALVHPIGDQIKTGDYTVVAGDNGKCLIANGAGAVNFTLPTLNAAALGLSFDFLNAANQNMVITGAANTILYDDTAGGLSTTLTFSTANQKMGARVRIRAIAIGAASFAWAVEVLTRHTVTAA